MKTNQIPKVIFSLMLLTGISEVKALKIINNSGTMKKIEIKDTHGTEFDEKVLEDQEEYVVSRGKLEHHDGPYIVYYERQKESIAKTIVTLGHRRTRDAGIRESIQDVGPNATIILQSGNRYDIR